MRSELDVAFQRRDYKDSSGAKPGTLFSLPEIWAHVQSEVRSSTKIFATMY